jgi:RND family efflux transporter MFP subunit
MSFMERKWWLTRRRFMPAALVGLALVVAAGWWAYTRIPQVGAVAAARGTAVDIVYATGGVEPVRWAKVASVIRDRIVDVCYCEGKEIHKGDVLAQLDDNETRAALRELKAREDFLKSEMSRVRQLTTSGTATMQAYEKAAMDLQTAQALVAVQTEKLADYTIRSPMDGVVLRRNAEIGEITEVGQILFWIGVPTPLQVVAEVNEEDIPRVDVGQTVLFRTDAFPDRRIEGTVHEITPMGDVNAKTYRIKVALPEDTPLKPGMSVEANIIAREKANALLVPTEAVQNDAVFVINGNRVHRRAVTVGIKGARMTEIVSGLNAGERVASPTSPNLTDGARVRIVASKP